MQTIPSSFVEKEKDDKEEVACIKQLTMALYVSMDFYLPEEDIDSHRGVATGKRIFINFLFIRILLCWSWHVLQTVSQSSLLNELLVHLRKPENK